MGFEMNRRGQVTIFIIIGIIIVAGIIVLFLFGGGVKTGVSAAENPQAYIEQCVQDAVSEAVEIMLPQAGYLEPENYHLYQNHNVGFLCYNANYYETCVNQEPMYIQHLKGEIFDYINPLVENCFDGLREEMERKHYNVNVGDMSLDIELKEGAVDVRIDRLVEFSKGDESRKHERFDVRFVSPLYDLGVVAFEIVNQEARFCHFEYLGYSLLYPQFNIGKTDIDGEVKIYIIEDAVSGIKMLIAIRSCALPAGI